MLYYVIIIINYDYFNLNCILLIQELCLSTLMYNKNSHLNLS